MSIDAAEITIEGGRGVRLDRDRERGLLRADLGNGCRKAYPEGEAPGRIAAEIWLAATGRRGTAGQTLALRNLIDLILSS